jgi:hypothetical protein
MHTPEREFTLVIDRIMTALHQNSRKRGHISMSFSAQPMAYDTTRCAASHTKDSTLALLSKKKK